MFVLGAALGTGLSNAQTAGLGFRPAGAAYSNALDRIVMVSANPNQLHIYDPLANTDTTVVLPEAPQNLSLTPDGLYAAVALVDAVSYVNLQSATIQQTFTNIAVRGGVAIAGSGYIYILPSYQGNIMSINIATGLLVTATNFDYASAEIFNSVTNKIYTTQDGDSINNLYSYSVSSGTVGSSVASPYYLVFPDCGPLWLSHDNTRIFSGCGSVFTASSDASKDMRYLGTLGALNSIQSLAIFEGSGQVAAIPKVNTSSTNSQPNDTEVDLFDSSHYNPIGKIQTNPFKVNSATFQAHGRWVFYNSAGTNLFVVTQADPAAGLTLDFAIDKINLQNSNSCNAVFAASSSSTGASGSYANTQVLAGEDCLFTAVSNAPWITLTNGDYGSGNSTLSYLVRPNLTSTSRSGTITMGAQSFTVSQAAVAPPSTFNALSINPVAADYDKPLDKIVMVAASPNELHIYDALSHLDEIVPLSLAPLSVSVSPDGNFAAIGHHGGLSYVNLQTRAVAKIVPVDMDIGGLVLAGNGYAYAFPAQTNSLTNLNSVNIASGALNPLYDANQGNTPRLYSSGEYIYLGSGIGFSKYDISGGPAVLISSSFLTTYGNNLWLSEDGYRLIDSTGRALFTSAVAAQDLQPDGLLSAASNVAWAANSSVQHQTAVLTGPAPFGASSNTQLQVYNDNGLTLQSQEALPLFNVGGLNYVSHGKYLFWSRDESKLFAITQADSSAGLLSSFAVTTIAAPEAIPLCNYLVSPNTINVPASRFGNTTWSFSVTSACNWSVLHQTLPGLVFRRLPVVQERQHLPSQALTQGHSERKPYG